MEKHAPLEARTIELGADTSGRGGPKGSPRRARKSPQNLRIRWKPEPSIAMTTPRGCLKSITTAFKRLARTGDVDGFRAYIRSDAFLAALNGLDPQGRQSAMRCYAMPKPGARPRRADRW